MIFEPEMYCKLEFAFDNDGDLGKIHFGKQGVLSVALLSKGAGNVVAGDKSAPVPAGGLIVANTPVIFVPQGECRILGVVVSGQTVQAYAKDEPNMQVFDSSACPDVPQLILRICRAHGQEEKAMLSATCYTLLCMLHGADSKATTSDYPVLVSGAIAAIHEHFAAVYGIEELADGLGVTKNHLVRRFKEHVGITPGQYLTNVRIDAAKQLLLAQDYSLDLVAALCGFSSANYFCKVFKKETGHTPREWCGNKFAQLGDVPAQNRFEEELYL